MKVHLVSFVLEHVQHLVVVLEERDKVALGPDVADGILELKQLGVVYLEVPGTFDPIQLLNEDPTSLAGNDQLLVDLNVAVECFVSQLGQLLRLDGEHRLDVLILHMDCALVHVH